MGNIWGQILGQFRVHDSTGVIIKSYYKSEIWKPSKFRKNTCDFLCAKLDEKQDNMKRLWNLIQVSNHISTMVLGWLWTRLEIGSRVTTILKNRYQTSTQLKLQSFDFSLKNKPLVWTLICRNLVETSYVSYVSGWVIKKKEVTRKWGPWFHWRAGKPVEKISALSNWI